MNFRAALCPQERKSVSVSAKQSTVINKRARVVSFSDGTITDGVYDNVCVGSDEAIASCSNSPYNSGSQQCVGNVSRTKESPSPPRAYWSNEDAKRRLVEQSIPGWDAEKVAEEISERLTISPEKRKAGTCSPKSPVHERVRTRTRTTSTEVSSGEYCSYDPSNYSSLRAYMRKFPRLKAFTKNMVKAQERANYILKHWHEKHLTHDHMEFLVLFTGYYFYFHFGQFEMYYDSISRMLEERDIFHFFEHEWVDTSLVLNDKCEFIDPIPTHNMEPQIGNLFGSLVPSELTETLTEGIEVLERLQEQGVRVDHQIPQDVVDKITGIAEMISAQGSNLSQAMNNMTTQFSSGLQFNVNHNINNPLYLAGGGILAVLIIYLLIKYPKVTLVTIQAIAKLIGISLGVVFAGDVVLYLMAKLHPRFRFNGSGIQGRGSLSDRMMDNLGIPPPYQSQDGLSFDSFFVKPSWLVKGALISYLGKTAFKSRFSDLKSFWAELNYKKHEYNKSSSAVVFITNLSIDVLNGILSFFGCETRISKFFCNDPEVIDYAADVSESCSEYYTGKAKRDLDFVERIDMLYKRGTHLQRNLAKLGGNDRDTTQIIRDCLMNLKPIQQDLMRSVGTSGGPRVEPIGCMFSGKPGSGKSFAVNMVMLKVAAMTADSYTRKMMMKNVNSAIFNRVEVNEFWDGYQGQPCCLYDDLGQATDVAGNPNNAAVESIKCINMNDFPLHMAAIEDKSNTHFISKFVFATTNREQFQSFNSIVSPEAFTRRYQKHAYWVCPAQEFSKDNVANIKQRRLDREKVQGTFGVFDEEFRFMEFYKMDLNTGEVDISKVYCMQDVVESLVVAYKEHKDIAERSNQAMIASVHKILREHGPDDVEYQFLKATGEIPAEPYKGFNDKFFRMASEIGIKSQEVLCSLHESMARNAHRVMKTGFSAASATSNVFVETFEKFKLHNETGDHGNIGTMIFECKKKWDVFFSEITVETQGTELFDRLNNTVEQSKRNFSVYYAEMLKFIEQHKKTLLVIVGVISVATAFYMSNRKDDGYVSQAKNKVTKFFSFKDDAHKFRVQGGYDYTCRNIVHKVVRKNMYTIDVPKAKRPRLGCLFFLGGSIAVQPRHFQCTIAGFLHDGLLTGDDEIIISSLVATNGAKYVITVDQYLTWCAPWVGLEHEDVVPNMTDKSLIIFPTSVIPCSHVHIAKHFMTQEDHKARQMQGTLIAPLNEIPGGFEVHRGVCTKIHDFSTTDKMFNAPMAYKYGFPTVKGQCGGLLAKIDNQMPRKLCGMHIAGDNEGSGVAIVITQEEILEAMEYDPHKGVVDELIEYTVSQDGVEFEVDIDPGVCSKFEGFRVLKKAKRVPPMMESSIRPSPIHGQIRASKLKPAYLRKTPAGVDVMKLARQQYAGPCKVLDPDEISAIAAHLFHIFVDRAVEPLPLERTPLDYETAIAGIPGDKHFKGLPRSTSAGYPLMFDIPPNTKGKQYFLGEEGDYDFESEGAVKLRHMVDEVLDKYKSGIRPEIIYRDFPKDEKRPIEKVDAGKTRMISGAPLHYVVLVRRFFGRLERWLKANNYHIGFAAGMNPYSVDWDNAVRVLGETLIGWCAGDYKHYDGSLVRSLMYAFLQLADLFYGPEDSEIRRLIFEDIMNSRHIFNDIVYEFYKGMPSGNPLTTLINTFCNLVLIYFMSLQLSKEQQQLTVVRHLDFISENIRALCMGDDNLLWFSELVRPWLNMVTLSGMMARYGFTYTDEIKSSELVPTRSLSEVAFLKRSFRWCTEYGRYVAPLSMETILEMSMWTKKSDEAVNFQHTKENIDKSLFELSLHGREVFDEYAPKFIKAAATMDYVPKATTYRACLEECVSLDVVY